MKVLLALCLVEEVLSHGMMQRPPSWQFGNVPLVGDAALPKPFFAPWPTACLAGTSSVAPLSFLLRMRYSPACAGACDWFVNSTFLSANQTPTIAQGSVLRTVKDPPGQSNWTDRHPWRSPGAATITSPCGVEGGNPNGCTYLDGTHGECVIDAGGFGYGPDGRTLGDNGVTTSWPRGGVVEVAWSLFVNHGGEWGLVQLSFIYRLIY